MSSTGPSGPVRAGRILPRRHGEPIEAWLRRLRQATAREAEQRARLADRVTTTTTRAEVPQVRRRGTK